MRNGTKGARHAVERRRWALPPSLGFRLHNVLMNTTRIAAHRMGRAHTEAIGISDKAVPRYGQKQAKLEALKVRDGKSVALNYTKSEGCEAGKRRRALPPSPCIKLHDVLVNTPRIVALRMGSTRTKAIGKALVAMAARWERRPAMRSTGGVTTTTSVQRVKPIPA